MKAKKRIYVTLHDMTTVTKYVPVDYSDDEIQGVLCKKYGYKGWLWFKDKKDAI